MGHGSQMSPRNITSPPTPGFGEDLNVCCILTPVLEVPPNPSPQMAFPMEEILAERTQSLSWKGRDTKEHRLPSNKYPLSSGAHCVDEASGIPI